jgi:hypothetical protein
MIRLLTLASTLFNKFKQKTQAKKTLLFAKYFAIVSQMLQNPNLGQTAFGFEQVTRIGLSLLSTLFCIGLINIEAL